MTRLFQIVAVLTLFLATTANLRAESSSPVRVRGTVLSIQGSDLAVKSRTGEDVRIRLADSWSAGGVVPAKLSDIKSGTFVGIASTPQPGGPSRAIEVLIFPEAMRGTGEGHYPWDLQPESTMTNATVVSDVQSVDGRALTLSYKAGEQKIVVGPATPIVTFAPAEKSDIQPGAAVFVPTQRQPDGTLQATRVLVGKGIVPPM
jgi:hypothetical protein